MVTVSGHPKRGRCPHCLSRKSLLRVSADLPVVLRILGERVWCDACLRHYFQLRLFGVLVPTAEPKSWEPA